MAIRLKALLKSYFQTGKKPTEEQFADLIDSFVHVSEPDGISEPNSVPYVRANGYRGSDPSRLYYNEQKAAFAAGRSNSATGFASSATGEGCEAVHIYSHAGGYKAITRRAGERAFGAPGQPGLGLAQSVDLAFFVAPDAYMELMDGETLVADCTYADATGTGGFVKIVASRVAGGLQVKALDTLLHDGLTDIDVSIVNDAVRFRPSLTTGADALGTLRISGSSTLAP